MFCGKFGKSGEHVFAKWLRELFPRDQNTTHTFGVINPSSILRVANVRNYRKPGHTGSRKIKDVCAECNNVWLSQIEESTKGILTPLIKGDHINLTPDLQATLATWAAKTAMTAERLRPRENGVRQSERTFLMHNLRPPAAWAVWIISYNGSRWANLAIAQKRGDLQFTPIRRPGIKANYIQATTWAMGRVGFLVLASDVKDIPEAFARFDGRGFFRIWPAVPRTLMFPAIDALDDAAMNDVADILTISGVLDNSLNRLANYRTKF